MNLAPLSLSSAAGLHPSATHLLTGATGFVGGAIALELLARTNDSLVTIVRPGESDPASRFQRAMAKAAHAYGLDLDPEAALSRCRVVAGDVTRPRCGVRADELEGVTHVWHCAASLRYEDRYEDEIRATNVAGTQNILELASMLGAEVFNYVSTAYVAGRTTGLIREQPIEDVEVNNRYERSKVDAERLVLEAMGSQARIFRPSIVVGHSRTLGATNFSGFYGFVRLMMQFRGMVDRMQAGFLERTPLRLRIDPDSPINFVPVDAVAREAVTIGLRRRPTGIFHLTHPAPSPTGTATNAVFEILGLPLPKFVTDPSELDWLDARLDQRVDFYRSYMTSNRCFDRSRTDAALQGTRTAEAVYDADRVRSLGRWYLSRLERERASLPVAR